MSPRCDGDIQARIWIGGLPDKIDSKVIEEKFERFGKIKWTRVNRSERDCFAFIQFDETAAAESAIKTMDQAPDFGAGKGGVMKVQKAKPTEVEALMARRAERGGSRSSSSGSRSSSPSVREQRYRSPSRSKERASGAASRSGTREPCETDKEKEKPRSPRPDRNAGRSKDRSIPRKKQVKGKGKGKSKEKDKSKPESHGHASAGKGEIERRRDSRSRGGKGGRYEERRMERRDDRQDDWYYGDRHRGRDGRDDWHDNSWWSSGWQSDYRNDWNYRKEWNDGWHNERQDDRHSWQGAKSKGRSRSRTPMRRPSEAEKKVDRDRQDRREAAKDKPFRVKVSNLPDDYTEEELQEVGSEFGQLLRVEVMKNSRGVRYGNLHYRTIDEAVNAIRKLHNRRMEGVQDKLKAHIPCPCCGNELFD
eukprot:TRINITY_DN3603_c1_g1_i1.p1 TRINITY_DN3603_c1_g1~~TRINITY_DN3603_c1_g1_i1.p1  ORF type:complete len:420 (-),score=89.87 TRINITY_DN3603_c1_g1_i1:23-1282(-)